MKMITSTWTPARSLRSTCTKESSKCQMNSSENDDKLWKREKGRDLTQSYDKSPYTNKNVIRAKWQHKKRHKKFDYKVVADRQGWRDRKDDKDVVKMYFLSSTSRIPLQLVTFSHVASQYRFGHNFLWLTKFAFSYRSNTMKYCRSTTCLVLRPGQSNSGKYWLD